MKLAFIFTCFLFEYASSQTCVWSDEFDGPAGQLPDTSKWGYNNGGDGWGNQERQYYTDSASNAALDGNGNLVITARKENPNNVQCWYGQCECTSARLLTSGKFSHLYGTIKARIKLPIGKGFWPAFWMLGDNFGTVAWPECGEIDIMENVGNDPLNVHGSLHGTGYSGGGRLINAFHSPSGEPLANDFQIYRILWSPNSITFSVDETNYGTKTPSDTHAMITDYLRVYNASDTPAPITKKIRSSVEGLCLDVAWASSENETPVQAAVCSGNTAQNWPINENDHTIRALGKCLEVAGGSTENGANVQIYDCNGSDGQQWTISAANDIVSLNAIKCLDIRTPAQDGAHAQIWDCAGSSNQKWTLV